MARSVREIFLNITTRYEDEERGFNAIQREMRDLRKEVENANGAFDAQIKALKDHKKQMLKAYDPKPIRDYLDELEGVQRQLDKIGRSKLTVDPQIRAVAKAQSLALQDRIEAAHDMNRQLAAAYAKDVATYEAMEAKKEKLARVHGAARVAVELAVARQAATLSDSQRESGTNFRQLQSLPREADRAAKAFDRAAQTADTWGDRLGNMMTTVKSLVPLLRGLSIVIGVSMVSAIGALVSSLALAVGAVLGLGAAMMAALGPAVALLIGFFNRLAAVMKVVQAREQAGIAAQRAQADRARIQAEHAQRLSTARRGLRNATEAVTDAEQALADASENLEQAEVAAWREMEDAAEAYRDALLEVEDAKLGIRDAKLDLKEAQLALKEFREEADVGDSLDGLFKKFEDVNFQPGRLGPLIAEAKKKGELDSKQALELERLLLNVDRAKQGEKKATDSLSDANRNLTRTRQEDLRFQREGIMASQSYASALRGVESATRSLRDAHEGVGDAQAALTEAQRARTEALAGNTEQLKEYERLLGELSPAERGFAEAIAGSKDAMVDFVRSGTDPMFAALTRIVGRFREIKTQVQSFFSALGQTVAANMERVFSHITSDGVMASFERMAPSILSITDALSGPAVIAFFDLWRNLAEKFMPHLDAMVQSLVGKLQGAAAGASLMSPDTVQLMVDALSGFMGLVGALIRMFAALGLAGGEFGNGFLGFLTDGIDKFTEFLKTAEGQKRVQQFFKDTIPVAKALMKFVGKLALAFLLAFEVFAPIITSTLNGFSTVVDIINILLGVLLLIPAPIRGILGVFLPFIGIVRGGLYAITVGFRGIKVALGVLVAGVRALGLITQGSIGIVRDLIVGLWNWLKTNGPRVVRLLLTPYRLAWEAVKAVFNVGKAVVLAVVGAIVEAFQRTVNRWRTLGSALVGIAGRIWDGIKSAFGGIKDFVSGVFNGAFDIIKSVINRLIRGINVITRLINKIPNIKAFGVNIGIPDIPPIPQLASGGIARRSVFAELGEAGREAILPLSRSILAQIGQGIAASSPALAAASGGRGGIRIDNVNLPPAPQAAVPDARYQASQLALLLGARGLG